MVLATSSTRRVISCSTASAEAPGYWVSTMATGMVMSGIWSTESFWYEKTPSTMKATILMVAKTGFPIEMRVNPMALALGRGLDHRLRARLEPLGLHRDHRDAALEPLAHLDEAALLVARAQAHRAPLDLAVLHHVDEGLAAFLEHGGGRDHVDLGPQARGEGAAREHAAARGAVGIGNRHEDRDRPRARFGRGVHALDAAGEGPPEEAVDAGLDVLPDLHVVDLAHRHLRLELHPREVHEVHHRHVRGGLVAHVHPALGDDAGEGGADLRVADG